jgi:hypothetical protein
MSKLVFRGYKVYVVPSSSAFNLAILVLEFLLDNATKWDHFIYAQIFKALFDYLYTTNSPVPLKVYVLKLLVRVIQKGRSLPPG